MCPERYITLKNMWWSDCTEGTDSNNHDKRVKQSCQMWGRTKRHKERADEEKYLWQRKWEELQESIWTHYNHMNIWIENLKIKRNTGSRIMSIKFLNQYKCDSSSVTNHNIYASNFLFSMKWMNNIFVYDDFINN